MQDLNALPLPHLYAELASTGLVRRLLELARDEDLGPAGIDITTRAATGGDDTIMQAVVRARQACVIAGLEAADDVLEVMGVETAARQLIADGERAEPGQSILELTGPAATLLVAERTLLNLLGRLSGVATTTARYVDAMRSQAPDSTAVLVDTRKTTPGMRVLEKYAVRCGGGMCHRIGLYDAVLLKDNHLAGVSLDALPAFVHRAADAARGNAQVRFVEVEVDTLEQFEALLSLPAGIVDIVLLDNMALGQLERAVRMRPDAGPLLEASGGVTLETIGAIARTGVHRISVGALTHGAVSVDLGLDVLG
ncbi:MAG: carboxylating nicotinate-nucleotide diphosphorylase [Planctomycetota bacterium]